MHVFLSCLIAISFVHLDATGVPFRLCKVPKLPANTEFSYPTVRTYLRAGSALNLACSNGYKLQSGSLILACEADGQFKGEYPVCIAAEDSESHLLISETVTSHTDDCSFRRNIPGVQYLNHLNTGGIVKRGRVLVAACSAGYKLISGRTSRRCTLGGTFEGAAPVCARIRCNIDVPKNARIVANGQSLHRYYMETVELECLHGFARHSGDIKRTCLSSGLLSGEDLTCKQVIDFGGLHPTTTEESSFFTFERDDGDNSEADPTSYSREDDFDGMVIGRKSPVNGGEAAASTSGIFRFSTEQPRGFTLEGTDRESIHESRDSDFAGGPFGARETSATGSPSKPSLTFDEFDDGQTPTPPGFSPEELEAIDEFYDRRLQEFLRQQTQESTLTPEQQRFLDSLNNPSGVTVQTTEARLRYVAGVGWFRGNVIVKREDGVESTTTQISTSFKPAEKSWKWNGTHYITQSYAFKWNREGRMWVANHLNPHSAPTKDDYRELDMEGLSDHISKTESFQFNNTHVEVMKNNGQADMWYRNNGHWMLA